MNVLPRADKKLREIGWTLDLDFIQQIAKGISSDEANGCPVAMEDAENIMLAAERYAAVAFARRLNRIAGLCRVADKGDACRAILEEVHDAMSSAQLDPGQCCQICGRLLSESPPANTH